MFIRKAPERDGNVNMKTLIPFLFNCVFIDSFIYFPKPRVSCQNDLCMLTKSSLVNQCAVEIKFLWRKQSFFLAHSPPQVVWLITMVSRLAIALVQSCPKCFFTQISSGGSLSNSAMLALLFQLTEAEK